MDAAGDRKKLLRRKSAVIGTALAIVGVIITRVVGDSYQNNPWCWEHVGWWGIAWVMILLGLYGGWAAVPVIWKFDRDPPDNWRRLVTIMLAPFVALGVVAVLSDNCG